MNENYIHLRDLSDNLLKKITSRLHTHSTSLFRLTYSNTGDEQALHIGAGTFVNISGIFGILTATHVADKLRDDSKLGLIGAREGVSHRFCVDPESILIFRVSKPNSDEYGPDAAFISLADWDKIGTIKASRSFHLFERDREILLENPPELIDGIWCICGTPEEYVRSEYDQPDFQKIIAIESYCGVGGVDKAIEREGWDYLEFPVVDEWRDLPSSFSGMSGGSIWQVTLRKLEEGVFEPINFFLRGVVFYQGVREDGVRFLRCHGTNTIYESLYNLVKEKYA